MTALAFHPHGELGANLAAFCALLRRDYGFAIGPGEAADALRALEWAGVADLDRVRTALRLVLCARAEEIPPFDEAFDAFFLPAPPRGVLQHNLHPRHTRPQPEPDSREGDRPAEAPAPAPGGEDDAGDDAAAGSGRRQVLEENQDGLPAWSVMRAPYSALAAQAPAPEIPREGLEAMLDTAGLLLRRLRLGRSRRWRPMPAGSRFDFRRTLRAGLQTGGEPLKPRWSGHPHRNPRIAVIVDGSRSMSDGAAVMLQFAYAVGRRTRRLDAFVFSTDLRDVTQQVRRLGHGGSLQLSDLRESWGGGTRIGACLWRFIAEFGHRCLSEHTVVFILSDGLDVGEPDLLRRAMHELHRRCAGLIWLNPLLSTPGYVPSAQGMQAALPYIDHFGAAGSASDYRALARTLRL